MKKMAKGGVIKNRMRVGTKFKGQINGEVFEIVDETVKDNKTYWKVKHLKSGKTYEYDKRYIEHLLVWILEE